MTPQSTSRRRRSQTFAAWVATVLVGLLVLGVADAGADLGVRSVSRHAGGPGQEVTLTLGCGFCFPPCVGPKGERHPKGFDHGVCMLGTKREPPRAFQVFLVSIRRGADPPARPVPHPLGAAKPPPGGNDPTSGQVPRYVLPFTVPDLRPGLYAYEIRCGACAGGHGSLVSDPGSARWRLRIAP